MISRFALTVCALAPRGRTGDKGRVTQCNAPTFTDQPDAGGHFGQGPEGGWGGRYAAETLMAPLMEVQAAWDAAKDDPAFWTEFDSLARDYIGRPSPLYFAEQTTRHLGGAKIYFKRDELNHTGAHKINHCVGQILLARRMGKTRIIAETGAGQHGVAAATVCALFKMPCVVYMGAKDVERQRPNVFRMRLLGAEVRSVESGSQSLKDSMNEAMRDWVTNVRDTFYIIGTAAGPHPCPAMVRDMQSVIGREAREQVLAREGRAPDTLVACIGGGSNALGLFHPFLGDAGVRMVGVEAAGRGVGSGATAASIAAGSPGVLHGMRSMFLQDADGQITEAHSISAGLDYPGIGPEHAFLSEAGRVEYASVTDDEAMAAFQELARLEGILPALEPAHAFAQVMKLAPTLPAEHILVMNLCGRGDKDIFTVARALGAEV